MRRTAPGEFALETDERFWNQIGPFGGWLAAAAMRAMRDELAPAWQPRSFHAHFVGALARGELRVRVQELRRQRTVLALRAEIAQGSQLGVSAECVFGLDRGGSAYDHPPPPRMDAPRHYPRMRDLEAFARFPAQFDYRVVQGAPLRREGPFDSHGYLRLEGCTRPAPEDLLLLADAWYPAPWAGLVEPVPVSTLALSVLFRNPPPADAGHGFLAVHHRTDQVSDGYADERGELWWPDGRVALQCQQLTWVNFSKAHARV
jgi:acyl-CoA thioesterase